jgi:hypothetical protein
MMTPIRGVFGILTIACVLTASAAPPPLKYKSLTEDFDAFAAETIDMPRAQRVALFRKKFGRLFPGFYEPRGRKDYDHLVAQALEDFPEMRPAYIEVERSFPDAFASAVDQFRVYFPNFTSAMPIWFVHSLGEMDGGTRQLNGHGVVVFGADVITKFDSDRMQPFLDHELFHVEHAHYFSDCDPLWCSLWQEGLAVYAASKMNPGATDHQLLLTEPRPIRGEVDQHWQEALCLTADKLDSVDPKDNHDFLYGGQAPPQLPSRFGYYVAYRIVQRAGDEYSLADLTKLHHDAARRLFARTLSALLNEAHANCQLPR